MWRANVSHYGFTFALVATRWRHVEVAVVTPILILFPML